MLNTGSLSPLICVESTVFTRGGSIWHRWAAPTRPIRPEGRYGTDERHRPDRSAL